MTTSVIRSPHLSELGALSALNVRSKAYWGYDPAFMKACVKELTVSQQDLMDSAVGLIEVDGQLAGMAQVGAQGDDADLQRLFVDPPFIGSGVGRRLFDWCVSAAKDISDIRLLIEADPQAAPFYEHLGAKQIGEVSSGSIPGRMLPLLEYPLR